MSLTHTIEYFLLYTFALAMRALPRRPALAIGAAMGQLAWMTRFKRRLVLDNIGLAFPDLTLEGRVAIGARSARNFARTITEYVRFAGSDRAQASDLVDVSGVECLNDSLNAGNGVILITGHFGSWALYFYVLTTLGIPVSLLVGKQHNKKVDEFIHKIPGDLVEMIPKGRSSIRKILASMKAGRCVIMVADQHAGATGIYSEFLGRKAPTLALPGAFYCKHNVPVFLMTGYRNGDDRHVVNVRPLEIPKCENVEEQRQAVTDTFNEALGEVVLERPDQYFWFHRRWRDGDAELYSQ